MDNFEQRAERQVSIKDMLYTILMSWRKVLIFALIFALLCGCYKLITQSRSQDGIKTAFSDSMEVYQKELTVYEKSRKDLKNEIIDINTNIERLNKYNENSLLMKIDPFGKYTSTLVFYIDTDYQINPNLSYQDVDNTKSVLKAYYELFNNGDMYDYIMQNLSYETEEKYIKELVNVYADFDTNLLYVQVMHKEKISSEEILNLINDQIVHMKDKIESSVSKHDLKKIKSSTQSSIDTDLEARQKINKQNLIDYKLRLLEKDNALESLVTPIKPVLSDNASISTIKFAMIGFVLGAFLAILIIVLALMSSSKLLSYKDYRQHFDYNVIGRINKEIQKRAFSFIDYSIHRLLSGDTSRLSYAEEINLISANIKAFYSNRECDAEEHILITGSASNEKILKLFNGITNELSDASNLNMECAANLNYSSTAIEKLIQCRFVILIEEVGCSTYEEISREIETIKGLNKEIIGVVIV